MGCYFLTKYRNEILGTPITYNLTVIIVLSLKVDIGGMPPVADEAAKERGVPYRKKYNEILAMQG